MQTPKIPLLDYEAARFFAALPKEKKKEFIAGLTDAEAVQLRYLWEAWARGTQLPPPGRWVTWLNMGGRGAGKTRAGSEWIRKKKETTPFLHLIGRTAADVRDVMVDGESGILAISPPWDRPTYQRSKRRLVWNNGAQAITFSADEPESLRGPQCFIGSTKVLMADGSQKPISMVQVGEYVMTRSGAHRITASCLTKKNTEVYLLRTLDGRSLVGTAEHPVWVQGKGFVPMSELMEGMPLLCVKSALNGMDTSGICVRGKAITSDASCYIGRSGNKPMDLSPKGIISTIKMGIKQIIAWKTWNCFPLANTLHSIIKKIWSSTRKKPSKTHAKRWKLLEKSNWRETLYALFAERFSIKPLSMPLVFAQLRALMHIDQEHLKGKLASVNTAVLSIMPLSEHSDIALEYAMVALPNNVKYPYKLESLSVNGATLHSSPSDQMLVSVQEIAPLLTTGSIATVKKSAKHFDVYDITVEDAHEFFAEGILVHNCGGMWLDEIGAWQYEDAFDQAMFGLRLGSDPQACATTTPRVTKLIKKLLSLKTTAITRSSTYDNKDNLAEAFFTSVIARYENSRLGRQELEGELLEDFEGALWNRDLIENNRVVKAPELIRVVVGVDPAVTNNEDSDETGIIVAGKGVDGEAYVLADYTLKGSPLEWGQAVVSAYHLFSADRVVGETNNGGDLIEQNIRLVDPDVSYKSVHASRGKQTRAEPIVSLYEQGRAHHVGLLAKLEDEQCTWEQGKKSPNRLDACVWALTELGFNNGYIPVVVSSSTAPTVPQRYTSDDEEENARLAQQQERVASIMNRLRKLGGVPL